MAQPTRNQMALVSGVAVALACGAAGRTVEAFFGGLLAGTLTAGVIYRDDSTPDWRVLDARAVADARSQLSGLIALVAGKASEAVPYVKAAPPLTVAGESLILVVPTSLWRREHVGYSRAAEIDLGRILQVRAEHGLIDVAHHDRQHQERFSVEHADLIANLVDVSAQRCQLLQGRG